MCDLDGMDELGMNIDSDSVLLLLSPVHLTGPVVMNVIDLRRLWKALSDMILVK